MMAISKKAMNTQALEKNIELLMCPICSLQMQVVEDAKLVCEKNHSFDLSRQGYVNLAPQAHVTKYNQMLFEARNILMTNGFFDPLLERIVALLDTHFEHREGGIILDAGSGEGSHLAQILSELSSTKVSGVGIDLAKEGVGAAAKNYPGNSWIVADLANCPFTDDAFDVLLNILSPANYGEFTRLIKEDGLFIKVVPEKDYLHQLRTIFYEEAERESEGNPVERVAVSFQEVWTERVTYDFPLNSLLLESLIRMTPLTWGASEEKIESALSSNLPFVTIDFTMIIGKN